MNAIYFNNWEQSYIPQILDEIYLKKVYAPFLKGKRLDTIVDIGGNIGLSSMYFSNHAKRVFCIEPAKQHLECIQAMVKQNDIKNIIVCPYAISNTSGKAKFYHNPNVTMFSLKDTVNDKSDYEEVQTVRPDEFMELEDISEIDLLKLDTEGSESEIITSEGFAKIAPKIKVIVGEHHSWSSMNQQQFGNALADLGFTVKWNPTTDAAVFSAVRV